MEGIMNFFIEKIVLLFLQEKIWHEKDTIRKE